MQRTVLRSLGAAAVAAVLLGGTLSYFRSRALQEAVDARAPGFSSSDFAWLTEWPALAAVHIGYAFVAGLLALGMSALLTAGRAQQ